MNILKIIFVTLFAVSLLFTVPETASADWSLNPFDWGTKKTTKKKSEPSTLSKINRSTKTFFVKTGDFLNPFSESKRKYYPSMPKVSMPSLPSFTSSEPSSKKKKSSGWGSWFGEEEEVPPVPRTVSEFMSLERSKF